MHGQQTIKKKFPVTMIGSQVSVICSQTQLLTFLLLRGFST